VAKSGVVLSARLANLKKINGKEPATRLESGVFTKETIEISKGFQTRLIRKKTI
jgi:hypothetical protein